MTRLAVLGATGRMGTRVLALVDGDPRFDVVAAVTDRSDPRCGDTIEVCGKTLVVADGCDLDFDVLIDFSVPEVTIAWVDGCVSTGAAMVIGATGHTTEQLDRLHAASARIAILRASNFSVGVNLLLDVVGEVARRLGDAYDIELIEHHHNRKIDAPSGTALSLLDAVVDATGRDRDVDVVFGRSGDTGARPHRQIGVHAVRMGELVGHHELHFSGPGESLRISHTAHSRDTFARGAIEAAAWLAHKPAGVYGMRDFLSAS